MRLYVLLTQAHCRIPILDAARQVIAAGADVVQLREKELPDKEMIRLADELRRLTTEAGVGFIMNDRADLAVLCNADGVHLGQEDLPPPAARTVVGEDRIIGVSTHSVEQAHQAVADGADYIGVGPVYPTITKGYDKGVGLGYIRAAAECAKGIPLVAIGGITAERVPEIFHAAGSAHIAIAVCNAILGADDIGAATASFRETIDRQLARS